MTENTNPFSLTPQERGTLTQLMQQGLAPILRKCDDRFATLVLDRMLDGEDDVTIQEKYKIKGVKEFLRMLRDSPEPTVIEREQQESESEELDQTHRAGI